MALVSGKTCFSSVGICVCILSAGRNVKGEEEGTLKNSKNKIKKCNHPLLVALRTCGENSLCASFYILFNYSVLNWSVLYVLYLTPAIPYHIIFATDSQWPSVG